MAYWCDDYGLYLEQRRLDEEQRRAALAIEARHGQDAKRLDPKDESAGRKATPGNSQQPR